MSNGNIEKYYREISRRDDVNSLYRNSPSMLVTVELPVEREQNIFVYLTKNGNSSAYGFPQKTDDFSIIKPIAKTDFQQAYDAALRLLHQHRRKEGNFYLIKRNDKPPNGVAWFSEDEHNKKGLQIEFHDHPKDFSLHIETASTWKGIQHFRKANRQITAEQFESFFKVVINFLHDPANYAINFPSVSWSLAQIVKGNHVIRVSNDNNEMDQHYFIEKIRQRITALEKRLMEQDTDSPEERSKLRGEIEGLKFAMRLAH